MKTSRYLVLTAAFFLCVQNAKASSLLSEQTIGMSLADALYLGLRNNREIRSAYLQREGQKFDLRVAEDAFKPKLLLKSEYTNIRSSEDQARQLALTPTATLLGQYGTRLNVGWTQQLNHSEQVGHLRSDGINLEIIQPLLRGSGPDVTTAPLRLARLSEQANRLHLKANISQTVSTIITTYRELIRAQEQLGIVQASLQRARALLTVNKALINAGRMAQFEIVQTEADIAVQELSVEEAQNQLDIQRLALLRLLALDLSTNIQATEAVQATPLEVDLPQAIHLAQAQQPQYLSTLLNGQQAALDMILAKDAARWDLSLVAGASQVREHPGTGSARRWESYTGLQLEIPIGDISTRQAQTRARINVEQQQLLIADARQELERNVSNVVRELGTRWRQYEIALRANELSTRKLDIEREKLSVGRSSNFQIISFENDLRDAENARINALIAYLNAQTQLDETLGMTLEKWEIALEGPH